MASNTENLDLLMKNPSTDGADTFNVQTMLNENWQKIDNNAGSVAKTLANILKPTTPPIIGLPPSTTPDGMFQALGNTGELHVWRKTVKNAADVPAGYNLGTKTQMNIAKTQYTSGSDIALYIDVASSVTVSDSGDVSLSNATRSNISLQSNYSSKIQSSVRGKFVTFTPVRSGIVTTPSGIYFIPSDATVSYTYAESGNPVFAYDISAAQTVTGYPLTPAGTTTTYPVSTNPNAYQEGSDAKPAGYTLGDATNGVVISDMSGAANFEITTGTSVNVSDDGAVALGGSVTTLSSAYNLARIVSDLKTYGSGKFCSIVCTYKKEYTSGKFLTGIWYIPSDATMSVDTTSLGVAVNLSVVGAKPVTGYAAIPAGTTIEYLGRLGDKARVQVLSYVGTGTYGSSNPNSLTFDFVPKMVIIRQEDKDYAKFDWIIGMTSVGVHWDGHYTCFVAIDGKKLSFYNPADSVYQMNESGQKYYAIAIG